MPSHRLIAFIVYRGDAVRSQQCDSTAVHEIWATAHILIGTRYMPRKAVASCCEIVAVIYVRLFSQVVGYKSSILCLGNLQPMAQKTYIGM